MGYYKFAGIRNSENYRLLRSVTLARIIGQLATGRPWPIMLKILPIRYMFLSSAQNIMLPNMLNIMAMTTTIMPQFVYDFIILNDSNSII